MTFDDVIDTHAEPDRRMLTLERIDVESNALRDLAAMLTNDRRLEASDATQRTPVRETLAYRALRTCILDRDTERDELLARLEAQARRPEPTRVGEVAVEVIALREARQRIDGVCRVLEGMHEPPPGHVLDGLDEALRAWAVSVISSVERIALAVNPAMLPPAP